MRVLIDTNEIHALVSQMAENINRDYRGKELVAVGILKGCLFFMTDLLRKITIPVEIDFLEVSSYEGTESKGKACIKRDVSADIIGRHVLVIDTVMDSGLTLSVVRELLLSKKPETLRAAVFLDKPSGRKKTVSAEYVGKIIPDVFIVGYGQDYNGRFRNLPDIRIFER